MTKTETLNRLQLRLGELSLYVIKEATGQAQWRDNEDAQRAARDVSELLSKLEDKD